MSNPIPSALALTTINDGALMTAAPLRNNYAAIQAAVNELIAALSGGSAGQVLSAVDSSDVLYVNPPGFEIGYDQITATVPVSGTTSGAPTTVIAGSAHTFDGAAVMAEFYAPEALPPATAGATLNIAIYEGASVIAIVDVIEMESASSIGVPVVGKYRFTPSAGVHTYSIKAWVSVNNSSQVVAGGGGGANNAPAFLRFTKV